MTCSHRAVFHCLEKEFETVLAVRLSSDNTLAALLLRQIADTLARSFDSQTDELESNVVCLVRVTSDGGGWREAKQAYLQLYVGQTGEYHFSLERREAVKVVGAAGTCKRSCGHVRVATVRKLLEQKRLDNAGCFH